MHGVKYIDPRYGRMDAMDCVPVVRNFGFYDGKKIDSRYGGFDSMDLVLALRNCGCYRMKNLSPTDVLMIWSLYL